MRLVWSLATWVVAMFHAGARWALSAVHAVAHHTGLPVVVVAAAALVVSFRLARGGTRIFLEMAVALALVAGATKLGWIVW